MTELTHGDLLRAIGQVEATQQAQAEHLKRIGNDVSDLKAQANRWKGGLLVVLCLGSIIAFGVKLLTGK